MANSHTLALCPTYACIIGCPPHKINVQEQPSGSITECDFVGFLSPCVDHSSFAHATAQRQVVLRARVRLWFGLDELLERCEPDEVQAAWDSAIAGLSECIRNPTWKDSL